MPGDPASIAGIARRSPSSSPSLASPSLGASASARNNAGAPARLPDDGGENAAISAPAKSPPSASVSSTSSSSARPSLLSRLSLPLPLRSRNRSVVDFHIRCDEPYRKYTAGDSVRGAVVVVVVKPMRITHLVVSLHGYVAVLKDPKSVAKAQNVTTLPPPGSSQQPQYQGNGLTSLFQDEQVLSGEGRIEPGKYEFGFDLMFPNKKLPSSIDFERGTISYKITATLTRPTTIAPTSTCDRKVILIQQMDVGLLPVPRPRTIFLEPISKRTRRKKSTLQDRPPGSTVQEFSDLVSEADSSVFSEPSGRGDNSNITTNTNKNSSGSNISSVDNPLLVENRTGAISVPSDLRSDISGESTRSISTTSRAEFTQLSQVGSTLTSAAKQQVVDDKTITATIELLKGGCLPGNTVSVRVTVQHIKMVKSMTGVIVTLFRQGRIDTSPPPSLFSEESSAARKLLLRDDPHTRSRTSLGGLSLSSTRSTSLFRKDLDQNATPLIIDPVTLKASVTVSVRLPDDAFPTIRGVPGNMISFRYQVEVIVDLGGRLSAQLGIGSTARYGVPGGTSPEQNLGSLGQRGTNVADTSQVRREKGVISVSFELVVGTVDSSTTRLLAPSIAQRTLQFNDLDEEEVMESETGAPHDGQQHLLQPPSRDQLDYTTPPPHPADAQYPPWAATPLSAEFPLENGYLVQDAPSYIPPPQLPDPTNMTEKERIRQAETRLLPSEPADSGAGVGPSAPAGDDDDIYDAADTPRAPVADPLNPTINNANAGPSAPTEDELLAGRPAEDKQELERRRLMEEASVPPDFPDDADQPTASSSRGNAPHEPTAPDLNDEEDDDYPGYGIGAGPSIANRSDLEQLPAYQK